MNGQAQEESPGQYRTPCKRVVGVHLALADEAYRNPDDALPCYRVVIGLPSRDPSCFPSPRIHAQRPPNIIVGQQGAGENGQIQRSSWREVP
jgi:hypothetical protein